MPVTKRYLFLMQWRKTNRTQLANARLWSTQWTIPITLRARSPYKSPKHGIQLHWNSFWRKNAAAV